MYCKAPIASAHRSLRLGAVAAYGKTWGEMGRDGERWEPPRGFLVGCGDASESASMLHISPYLPISPHITPYLPMMRARAPRCCPHQRVQEMVDPPRHACKADARRGEPGCEYIACDAMRSKREMSRDCPRLPEVVRDRLSLPATR